MYKFFILFGAYIAMGIVSLHAIAADDTPPALPDLPPLPGDNAPPPLAKVSTNASTSGAPAMPVMPLAPSAPKIAAPSAPISKLPDLEAIQTMPPAAAAPALPPLKSAPVASPMPLAPATKTVSKDASAPKDNSFFSVDGVKGIFNSVTQSDAKKTVAPVSSAPPVAIPIVATVAAPMPALKAPGDTAKAPLPMLPSADKAPANAPGFAAKPPVPANSSTTSWLDKVKNIFASDKKQDVAKKPDLKMPGAGPSAAPSKMADTVPPPAPHSGDSFAKAMPFPLVSQASGSSSSGGMMALPLSGPPVSGQAILGTSKNMPPQLGPSTEGTMGKTGVAPMPVAALPTPPLPLPPLPGAGKPDGKMLGTVHPDLKNEADIPNSKVFDFPELKESDIKRADAKTGKAVAKSLASKDKPKAKNMGKVQDASNTPTTPKLLINKFATVPEKETTFDAHYNFDTQILPSILNRKEYTSKNKHLPKAVYKEDLDNALFLAAGRGDLNALRALLDRGANVEAHNMIGDTPLIHAALSGQAGSMRVLLARGAKADATNRQGLTALNLAAQRGRVDMVDALFENGAKAGRNYQDKDTANRSGLGRGYLSVLSAFQTGENPEVAKRTSRNRALEALASAGQSPKVLVTSGPGESAEIRDSRNGAAPSIEPGTSPSFDDVERGLLYQEYIKKTGSAPNVGALSLTTQPTTIIPLKETKLVADSPPSAFAPFTANTIIPNAPNTSPPMSVIPNAVPGAVTSPMQIPGANMPMLQTNNPAPASIPAMSRDQRAILPPPMQNNTGPNLAPFGRTDVTPGSPLPHPNEAEPMGVNAATTETTTGVTTTVAAPATSSGSPQSIVPIAAEKQFNPTGDGPPIAAESLLPPLPPITAPHTAP